jgi:outer membrane protein insertion porin family
MPGDDISKLIRKYWEHGLFEDVKISATKLPGDHVIINIFLKERPRLSKLTIEGVNKSDKDDLKEKLNLRIGNQVTENMLNDAVTIIKKFYIEKGFFNITIDLTQKHDTSQANRVDLTIHINKNKRVKIENIIFSGNKEIPEKRLRRALNKTKRRDWKFWNSSKFIEAEYKADKEKLIDLYNEKGYRDAKIISDSIVKVYPHGKWFINSDWDLDYKTEIKLTPDTIIKIHKKRKLYFKNLFFGIKTTSDTSIIIEPKKRINIYINLKEGRKYYFRNITWVGNTKYASELLSAVLSIKKGETFNQKILDKRLQSDDDAVSSLYLDNGYLFFSVTPTEVAVDNDSIDFEMRIYEGRQATINNVIITGNTKTNEHVVRREIRTLPGELFSKSDIIRTVRELATLGHFEPEKIEPVPLPNPANATVDIEYKLVEKANDQLEVSGGWGGYYGFIGTVGVRFSNFSYSNFFKWKEWRPVPSGDGQTLSLRLQSNGSYYRSYNATFADPWFGGKKPISLSVSGYFTHISNNTSLGGVLTTSNYYMNIIGASVNLGRRLKWPDDNFSLQNEVGYERYNLYNYAIIPGLSNGEMNNISFTTTFLRYSLDQPIYPRTGSSFSIKLQLTPPYSLLNGRNYETMSLADRYKWLEYHKWVFKSETYTSLIGNLVLMSRANFGFIGMYNNKVGYSPIGKFRVGGSGLNTYAIASVEIVALRGYEDGSITPNVDQNNNIIKAYSSSPNGGNLYDRFTAEMRYPVTLKESATIFGLVFAEAGNSWNKFESFNPFDIKRSVGFGIRVFLPMFGLLGFDMGYGFDNVYKSDGYGKSGWQPHFTMGQQF